VSHALEKALDDARAAELRRAARALLRRPLLRAGGVEAEDFRLVRRHAGELRSWFDANTGWRLIVDSEVARLVKLAPTVDDPTHCALAAADERLARAGVSFQLSGREERADLVAVVRLLLELGVLARVAGDEDAFVRDAGDALYDVERRVLAVVLAAPRGPSTIAAEDFVERLSRLAADPLPETEDLRNRALRHHLTRRLLDDPVLYNHELDPAQSAYLAGQRAALTRRISELTGLVAEVRAEGIAMVDPEDDLTDVRMPDAGTDGHVALLLAEHLARRVGESVGAPVGADMAAGGVGEDIRGLVSVSEEELHRLVRGLAEEHRAYWRRSSREPGAEVALVDTALDRLVALRLIRRERDGVRPLPALARYALGAPTIAEGRSQLELEA
jgi:uncharacterized protein (TIGR02678 family)